MEASSKTNKTPKPSTRANEPWFEIAEDAEGWHWLLWAGNGRAVARNATAYGSKKDCIQAIRSLHPAVSSANVVAKVSEDE